MAHEVPIPRERTPDPRTAGGVAGVRPSRFAIVLVALAAPLSIAALGSAGLGYVPLVTPTPSWAWVFWGCLVVATWATLACVWPAFSTGIRNVFALALLTTGVVCVTAGLTVGVVEFVSALVVPGLHASFQSLVLWPSLFLVGAAANAHLVAPVALLATLVLRRSEGARG